MKKTEKKYEENLRFKCLEMACKLTEQVAYSEEQQNIYEIAEDCYNFVKLRKGNVIHAVEKFKILS